MNLKTYRTFLGSIVVFLLLGFGLLLLAQIIRRFVFDVPVGYLGIPGLTLFFNDKFAFSIPLPTEIIYLIYTVIILSVLFYLGQNYFRFSIFEKVSWTFILAGALSNIYERICFGFVLDYFNIFTGVFNLADGYIIIGLLLLLLKNKK